MKRAKIKNKIIIALILIFGLSGNVFADAQSKCLKAVEKGKEIEHVNPDQDWRTGSATYKVYVYKGKAYRFYYLDGECKKIG